MRRMEARSARRGNAVLTGLMMSTLLGFSALSVDIGLIRVAKTELQASLDSAAVSAASELNGTAAGRVAAVQTAVEVAAANTVIGAAVNLPPANVVLGIYDPDTATFTVADGTTPNVQVNAVRIVDTGVTFDAILGQVAFGQASYGVTSRAMAVRSWSGHKAGSSECFLPFAIPDCHVANTPPGTNPPPMKFTFSPTPTDSVAWGDPDANPNSNDVRSQLLGQCSHDTIEIGDPMYVNEGSHTTALQTISDILNNSAAITPTAWDTSLYGPKPLRDSIHANLITKSDVSIGNWGNTLQGVVALVDGGSDCSAVSFTGSLTITGFAWGVVYDVKKTGSDKNVWMQLDLINDHEIWGEPDDSASGTTTIATDPPAMVVY
ncbi:MAG: hypothetical protein H6735_26470 [Alphaproteobacteria bacterium]|nr:hypothetical protein [Alphaproteobacteria bacterium]